MLEGHLNIHVQPNQNSTFLILPLTFVAGLFCYFAPSGAIFDFQIIFNQVNVLFFCNRLYLNIMNFNVMYTFSCIDINILTKTDRYVIVGVHYDAWTYGASDPNVATSVLTEMARSLSEMTRRGKRHQVTFIPVFLKFS